MLLENFPSIPKPQKVKVIFVLGFIWLMLKVCGKKCFVQSFLFYNAMSIWGRLLLAHRTHIMNKENLSLSVQMFNEKVRAMNQTQSRDLVLSSQEARNLHNDIFTLLSRIAELERNKAAAATTNAAALNNLDFDGGSF